MSVEAERFDDAEFVLVFGESPRSEVARSDSTSVSHGCSANSRRCHRRGAVSCARQSPVNRSWAIVARASSAINSRSCSPAVDVGVQRHHGSADLRRNIAQENADPLASATAITASTTRSVENLGTASLLAGNLVAPEQVDRVHRCSSLDCRRLSV